MATRSLLSGVLRVLGVACTFNTWQMLARAGVPNPAAGAGGLHHGVPTGYVLRSGRAWLDVDGPGRFLRHR